MTAHDRAKSPTGDDRAGERPPKSVRRLAYCGKSHRTHETARLGDAAPADPVALARAVTRHDRVTEAVVLATCNRVEVYVSARRPADREDALGAAHDALGGPSTTETATGRGVVEHLFRVACGLESPVLGEDHVLGQVRRAFERAGSAGVAGGVLSRLADAAVQAGRTAREETAINEGHASYGSATCEALAERSVPDRVVVVGAGEMAESVATAATGRWDATVDVVNRSPAPDLASEDGRYWPLPELDRAVAGADAVVAATGAPEPVLTPAACRGLDPDAVVVDLANPRDVAPAVADDHRVVELDEIQTRIEATAERRRAAVAAVESRLAAAVDRFVERERETRAEDTLRALHRRAAEVRESELERARHRLDDGDADPETVLEEFASALTGSLLGTPTDRLRTAAREGDEAVIEATHQLFDLDPGDEPQE